MLRDVIFSAGEIPVHSAKMPKKLMRRLDRVYRAKPVFWGVGRLRTLLSDLTGLRLRAPALALGTAMAMLVAAVLAVPIWQTFKEARQPQGMAPAVGSSSLGGKARLPEMRRGRKLPDLSESDQARLPGGREGREPASPQPESRVKAGPPAGLASRPGIPRPARESLPAGEHKYARPLHPGYGDRSTPTRAKEMGQPGQKARGLDSESEKRKESVIRQRAAAPRARMQMGRERQELPVPVEIKIVDQAGNPLPWVRFKAPNRLKERYSFFEAASRERRVSGAGRPLTSQELKSSGEHSEAARLIEVNVAKSGHGYDLTATLSRGPSRQVRKTEHAVAASRQEVPGSIEALVASLLSGP
jgi:hypothetical protein